MAEYTKDQLEQLNKETIVELFLALQEQYRGLDSKMQLMLEQLSVINRRMYGKSSERLDTDGQYSFIEVDGELVIYFNEAEAVADAGESEDEDAPAVRSKKRKGRRAVMTAGLPVVTVEHMLTDEQLTEEFGSGGWYRLPDEVYERYGFEPAKIFIEEHHVGVYKARNGDRFKKAPHPPHLLRNSLVSPSLEAAVINAKYVNAVPLYRQEQDFARYGIEVTRGEMARWTILCAERYLSVFYDYLHEKLFGYHVLQADETPVRVRKEDRTEGDRHYMWVYRTGKMYAGRQIVLYEYQPTRNSGHPREFLKNFSGVCVTDGYGVYRKLDREMEDLRVAGCWAHARRRFDEAVKALPKQSRKQSLAYRALKMIQAIYREEDKLKNMTPAERLEHRRMTVRPLVDAYFAWAKQSMGKVPAKGKTWDGFNYSINQEKYLRVFLEDGEVPMDNNSAEQSIRGFCIGKKNWVIIDTIAGAEASAIIYSIAETAKANNLKPYDYFRHLLEVIPAHMDDHDTGFCEDLLPWSDKLPACCRKPDKAKA